MKLTTIILAIVVAVALAVWRNRAIREGIRDEYRGWRKFRTTTGFWPLWSIGNLVISLPLTIGLAAYCFVAALETGRLVLIYAGLAVAVILSATLWFILRRLAANVDIQRAQRFGARRTLNRFLR